MVWEVLGHVCLMAANLSTEKASGDDGHELSHPLIKVILADALRSLSPLADKQLIVA